MSSKKNRLNIRRFHENTKNPESAQRNTWVDIKEIENKNFSKNFAQLMAIKQKMEGKKPFTIYLTEPSEGKFTGAFVQAGNFHSEIEVFPDYDQIHFSFAKKQIRYERVYSDWPSSISFFSLKSISKTEVLKEELV